MSAEIKLSYVEDLANLPPAETLPQSVQTFLGSLEGMEPAEKISLIHKFTQEFIQSRVESADNDEFRNFADLLKNPVGDCDDHAHFSAALLRYAGFDPKDIYFVSGGAEYRMEDKPDAALRTLHTVLIAATGPNGQLHFMDPNFTDTPVVNPRNYPFHVQGDMANERGDTLIRGSLKFDNTYLVFTYDGDIKKNYNPPADYPTTPTFVVDKPVTEPNGSFELAAPAAPAQTNNPGTPRL